MKNYKLFLFALFLTPLVWSCEDRSDFELEPPASGTADFSKYVAVGNSLAAGFQNNALYPDGQEYSYPNLLARQFLTPNFTQPEIGNGYGDKIEIQSFTDNPSVPVITTTNTLNPGVTPSQPTGGYQNLGIPGAVLADFLDADGNFASRFAASPSYIFTLGTPTPVSNYFNSQSATFATFWLGNNDVLGYVTSGGLSPFTNPQDFGTWYGTAIGTMLASNPNLNVVVANIPGVTSVPFTRRVGPGLKATLATNDDIQAIAVQKTFYANNPAVSMEENRSPFELVPKASLDNPNAVMVLLTSQTFLPFFGTSANTAAPTYNAAAVAQIQGYWRNFLVTAGVVDQATANGLSEDQLEQTLTNVTYGQYAQTFGVTPQQAAVELGGYAFEFDQPFGLHPQNPFPNQFILDQNEINIANAVTNLFNGAIAQVVAANASNVALVDVNSIFADIVVNGLSVDGLELQADLNSLFSFDGFHPTNHGHAVVANEFIKVINAKWGAEVPRINVRAIPAGVPLSATAQ